MDLFYQPLQFRGCCSLSLMLRNIHIILCELGLNNIFFLNSKGSKTDNSHLKLKKTTNHPQRTKEKGFWDFVLLC